MTATLTRALADLLACTYLDAVPTEAENDARRALAMDARVEMDAMRAREAALTAEVERLRADDEAARGELRVNIDEMAPGSTVRRLMLANTAMRRDRDAARADAANARAVATEAIDALDEASEWDGDNVASAIKVTLGGSRQYLNDCANDIEALRARLASPEAKGLRCLVDDLVDSSGPLVGIEYCEDPESERADREQRHATARALLLAALGAKET